MSAHALADNSLPRYKLTSDDYNLIIRQEPERAKVAGPKEKDRKPIDPPPILQLQIRDFSDPAQNYLQSPYYFICCNLCDVNLEESTQFASQTALAGTLVSSLHRLKDVDNTDGGFFVFGDLSVRIEGEFRLRFSLFEICKTQVVYIKSVTSEPFHVYAAKNFPGMAESTFLSRSFGDQGVRLRIRKEPRTLLKRPIPSSIRHENFPQMHHPQSQTDHRGPPLPSGYAGTRDMGPAAPQSFPHAYDALSTKRQRTSADLSGSGHYGSNATYCERDHDESRPLYNQYASRGQQASTYELNYPSSSNAAPSSDFNYRHQRTDSSSTTSPYASPRHDGPGFGATSAGSTYSSAGSREPFFQYPSGTLPIVPSRPAQLAQAAPTVKSQAVMDSSPTSASATYGRTPALEEGVLGYSKQTPRFYPTNASHQADSRLLGSGSMLDSLSVSGQYGARASFPNVLPPLESTVTAGHNRNASLPSYSQPGGPSGGGSLMPMAAPSMSDPEADAHPVGHHQLGQPVLSYGHPLYRRRDDG